MKFHTLCSLIVLATCTACNPNDSSRSRGPIVLGDSSTIVTETDPEALRDVVADLQVPMEQMSEAPAAAPADSTPSTAQPAPASEAAQTFSGNGLQLSFKELNVFFPGITARSYSKADLKKARSASFELQGGKLAGGKIQLAPAGGKINKVTQRYESMVGLIEGTSVLTLDGLGKYRSSWKELTPRGNAYLLEGLDRPEFSTVSAGTFKNAVQQKARRERMNRKETQELTNKARSYRSVKQAPARISLSAVLWRIEGEDAKGKKYTKELRIDVPR